MPNNIYNNTVKYLTDLTTFVADAVKKKDAQGFKERIGKLLKVTWNRTVTKIIRAQQEFVEKICYNENEHKKIKTQLKELKTSILQMKNDADKYVPFSRIRSIFACCFPFINSNEDLQERFRLHVDTLSQSIDSKLTELKAESKKRKLEKQATAQLKTLFDEKISLSPGISEQNKQDLLTKWEKQMELHKDPNERIRVVSEISKTLTTEVAKIEEKERVFFTYYFMEQTAATITKAKPGKIVHDYQIAKKDNKLPQLAQQAYTVYQNTNELETYYKDLRSVLEKEVVDQMWAVAKPKFEEFNIKTQKEYLTRLKDTVALGEKELVPTRLDRSEVEIRNLKGALLSASMGEILTNKPERLIASYLKLRQKELKSFIEYKLKTLPAEYEGLQSLCQRICNSLEGNEKAELPANSLTTLDSLIKLLVFTDPFYKFPGKALKAFKLDPKAKTTQLPRITEDLMSLVLADAKNDMYRQFDAYKAILKKPVEELVDRYIANMDLKSKSIKTVVNGYKKEIKSALVAASSIKTVLRKDKARRNSLEQALPFLKELKPKEAKKLVDQLEEGTNILNGMPQERQDFEQYSKHVPTLEKGWKNAKTATARRHAYGLATVDLWEKVKGKGQAIGGDEAMPLTIALFSEAKDPMLLNWMLEIFTKHERTKFETTVLQKREIDNPDDDRNYAVGNGALSALSRIQSLVASFA